MLSAKVTGGQAHQPIRSWIESAVRVFDGGDFETTSPHVSLTRARRHVAGSRCQVSARPIESLESGSETGQRSAGIPAINIVATLTMSMMKATVGPEE